MLLTPIAREPFPMSTTVFFAVLLAALLHASWNALVKIGEERLVGVSLVAIFSGLIAAVAVLPMGLPSAAELPWLGLSILLHTGYCLFLSHAYNQGDFGQIYPLARGSAPLLAMVLSAMLLGDYPGYGGLHYTNDSGRNDIVRCKVAIDRWRASFYVETREPLSPHTDPNWMLLLVDADQDASTGWCGYDYLINGEVIDGETTTLMRYTDGGWREVARVPYRAAGNALEVAAPRWLLGLRGSQLSFDFHWADNPTELVDAISLCTDGDSAPNRRFNYRCIWAM